MCELALFKKLISDLKGSKIKEITIRGGRYQRHGPPENFTKLQSCLPSIIRDISCYGKVLWLQLSCGWKIVFNFGMSGEIVREECDHCHLSFLTSEGIFYFRDPRNFGLIRIVKDVNGLLKHLGPDPLGSFLSEKEFVERFGKFAQRRKRSELAVLLLDQKFVAGIGNYLRADIMYTAKLNPFKKLPFFTQDEIVRLYHAITHVTKRSYDLQLQDNLGPQTSEAVSRGAVPKEKRLSKFIVYGKTHDPEGNDVHREVFKKRTVWWVPEIQE